MVSEQFKQNIKQYGREINAKLVFLERTLSGNNIVSVEKVFDADFMTTTMQEVNGEIKGKYDLTDKQFSFLFGVKPTLETTNQIDINFSGLRLVGDDMVQTMTTEVGKIYNLRMDVLNTSHLPMTIAGLQLDAGEREYIEDTIVADSTTYDLVISGESLHFVVADPHFELDNRFIEHEYINLGKFNVVEHERKVDAQGEDTTTFKAFDNMIRTHEMYDVNNLGIAFPLTVSELVEAIGLYTNLSVTTAGANLNKVITNDKWTGLENVTYRNILDEIAQATGTGITVFDNQLKMKEFQADAIDVVNEDDLFSLKLKQEFGAVNVVKLSNSDTKEEYHYPTNWETIPPNDRFEIVVEDSQIMKDNQVGYAADLFTEISKVKYYPFEADTQGFGYLNPLDIVDVIDMDNRVHRSVIMHSTLKIDSDVKETFKALPPVMHKNNNKVVKPEERKLNRVEALAQGASSNPDSVSWGDILSKPTTFTPTSHTHLANEVIENASKRFVSDTEKANWNSKVNASQVLTDVPSGALFTDTIVDVSGKADKTYVDGKVKTDVPLNAKFTDTIVDITGKADKSQVLTNVPANAIFTDTKTTINNKTGAITKADIVALGIPAQDTVVDISNKADKTYVDDRVKTPVPLGAVFTDTPTDISGKVDKVTGKGLSTNDYTTIEKNKLDGIETGANKYTLPATLPYAMLSGTPAIPTNNNELINGRGYITSYIDTKYTGGTNVTIGADNKINAIDTIYTLPTTLPYSMLTGTPTIPVITGKQDTLIAGANITITGTTISATDTKYTIPTTLPASGGNADTVNNKTVGINVPANAVFIDTVYTHPANHPASIITETATKRFVTDTEKASWNGKAEVASIPTQVGQLVNDKNYVTQAELGSAGYGNMTKGVYDTNNNGVVDNAEKVNGFTVGVNVPANAKFTDTNTTYAEISEAEINTGTASTLRTISARRLKYGVEKHAPTPEISLAGNVEVVADIIR